MAITEAAALTVLPLSHMKDELRIQLSEKSHDDLLKSQITQAVSHVSRRTGRNRRRTATTSGRRRLQSSGSSTTAAAISRRTRRTRPG